MRNSARDKLLSLAQQKCRHGSLVEIGRDIPPMPCGARAERCSAQHAKLMALRRAMASGKAGRMLMRRRGGEDVSQQTLPTCFKAKTAE